MAGSTVEVEVQVLARVTAASEATVEATGRLEEVLRRILDGLEQVGRRQDELERSCADLTHHVKQLRRVVGV